MTRSRGGWAGAMNAGLNEKAAKTANDEKEREKMAEIIQITTRIYSKPSLSALRDQVEKTAECLTLTLGKDM
jgi:hypothetical protein